MELERLESDLRTVMQEVLTGLLGEPTAPVAGAADPHSARLACAVSIDGGWHGRVVVSATLGLASLTAAHMFGDDLPGPPNPRDAQDALREIANIVAGNLKPLFGDHNTLGIPEDLASAVEPVDISARAIAHAVVPHGDGELEVRVFEAV